MKQPIPRGVWWMLELERKPGEWLATGHVVRRVTKPKPIPYDASGRRTRWVQSPVQSELAILEPQQVERTARQAAEREAGKP